VSPLASEKPAAGAMDDPGSGSAWATVIMMTNAAMMMRIFSSAL
jgi:hypothetical protein